MNEFFEYIKGVNELSVVLRLCLAAICGGIIGIEREHKHRQAGFRTHILISTGAAITTLISQFLIFEASTMFPGVSIVCDPARLGAQVISGMGFIGAGAIMVNKRRQVKGLTTAAGLWTTAIIGLSAGVGFYVVTLYCTLMIFLIETFFSKIEWRSSSKVRATNIYVEYDDTSTLNAITDKMKFLDVTVGHMEISKASAEHGKRPCAILGIYINNPKITGENLLTSLTQLEGVTVVEEL